MIDFLTSILWIGSSLIVLSGLAFWQLPGSMREVLISTKGRVDRPVQPDKDPPHSGPGAHVYPNALTAHTSPEMDLR